ncbi:hypothetical protein KGQ20_20945 [Catenulispora sp. NF23]|uniref:hypothetical protein n=1 Tax=Catenulispora pinistramenti TaxID=2705254 RepID=UPI001BA9F43D|nr:hypothetical protein [Catenulispora pinistramenti]MBS2535235.1 hypothetical protein [Catenulispora pinistramenti]
MNRDPSGDGDDVFGPIQDGEEVFEWIDDLEAEDGPAEKPARRVLTFRERLAAVRAGGRRLRRSRREVTAAAAAIVLACAIGGACTAWFDNVAGAADRAEVVSLAVDSVVDGDPAASSYNAASSSAMGQYLVEIANNGPDAVTLDSVSVDAGTLMMSSTGWKPLGPSARIPAGGTAEVALTVKLFCPSVLLGQQTGMFGTDTDGVGGGSALAFPAVHARVRDADGDLRDLTLPTRVTVSSHLNADVGQLDFGSPDGTSVPQIVSADSGACAQYAADKATQRTIAIGNAGRFPSSIEFGYDKVLTPASDGTFALGFTVKNISNHPEVLTTRSDPAYLVDSELRTDWQPAAINLAPGASASARLTISIHNCTSVLAGAPILGETMLEETDTTGGAPPQPVFIDQALTGSLRLAGDLVLQEKAAC